VFWAKCPFHDKPFVTFPTSGGEIFSLYQPYFKENSMLRRTFSRSFLGIALGIIALAILANAPCATAADGPIVGKAVKKIRKGRLPNYYADVVTDKQREDIHKIQEEYQPKIEALQTQIDALKKEMNEKVSAVLTEEQRKKVEEAAAKSKKDKKDDKPAAETKDAEPKPADSAEKKADK
jgi:hypothetical protein